MTPALHHRSLWSLDTLSCGDVQALLDSANALRRGGAARPLRGKNLALLNDLPGGDAPLDLQRAATDLGARVSRLRALDRTLGTARLLGRLYDAIDCDGLDDASLQQIDRDAGVPVFNGLAGARHPTRVLATLLDLRQRSGRPLAALRVAFVGDARSAHGDALLQAAALTGMELRIAASADGTPAPSRWARAQRVAQLSGARLLLAGSRAEALAGADHVLDAQGGAIAAPPAECCCTLQALLLSALA